MKYSEEIRILLEWSTLIGREPDKEVLALYSDVLEHEREEEREDTPTESKSPLTDLIN